MAEAQGYWERAEQRLRRELGDEGLEEHEADSLANYRGRDGGVTFVSAIDVYTSTIIKGIKTFQKGTHLCGSLSICQRRWLMFGVFLAKLRGTPARPMSRESQ